MATQQLHSMRVHWARQGVSLYMYARNVVGISGSYRQSWSAAGGVHVTWMHSSSVHTPLRQYYGSIPWNRLVVCAGREVSNQRQPVLSNAEKKVLRQKAQRMQDSLVTVNAGDKGLTVNFLSGLFDALKANQLVKVRMGCSRQEKKDKVGEIERILDCVCVHSIGSVVILFRQKGLSMPGELEGLLQSDDVSDVDVGKQDKKDDGVLKSVAIPDEFKVIGN